MINNMQLEEQIREIMAQVFMVDESDIPEDINQKNFSRWTSLQHMTLLVAIEEHYGIHLSMNEMVSMTSLAAILDVLKNYR